MRAVLAADQEHGHFGQQAALAVAGKEELALHHLAFLSRQLLEEQLRGEGDPRMVGRADFFDTIQHTSPRRHAYDTWLRD